MPVHHLQPSFSGGEVSPSLYARTDSAAYATWLKTARNFYVHPQGGVSNRPGTVFVGLAKYTGKPCRLIPFVLGEEEAYVLEFGEKYLRVYTSAGRLLNASGAPYEIATPYGAHELASLSYTQYNQRLFLTHPQYPPKQLARVSGGNFSFEDLPIRFGPFKIANENVSRKLRVVQSYDTITTEGVRASFSFLPIVDPNYFVQAYFNGEKFFTGHGYGLDVAFLVSEFNRIYGSSGCAAYNLGGVMKVESPQATGGDWNGVQFVLEYRNSFVNPAVSTVVQTLSGGSNQGTQIAEGSAKYVLESNTDLFVPGHVGGRFAVTHRVESQYLTATLGYETLSSTVKTAGDWKLRTSGSWTGTIMLEKSEDLGATWQTVKHFTRASGEDNVNAFGNLEDTGGMYLLRLHSSGVTGEAGFELQADSFLQEGVLVVSDFVSARRAVVTVERQYGLPDWTADWAEGSFSPASGYPACVFVYQDRLGLAGTAAEGQTIWFSKTASYADFGHARADLQDDDSFSVNLCGKTLNAIRSVTAAGKLLVFTAGSEWTVSCAGALTPYNVEVRQESERGVSRAAPVTVGNKALYVQARGSVLRDFYYDYNAACYTGTDLTLCAKHLFFNKEICELCYQQEPDNLIWCVLSDGMLAALTYLPEENQCAWTHHETLGAFRSACTVPNRGYDEVWFVVQRGSNWCVERLAPRLSSKEPRDQLFLDCSVSRKSTESFTEVTGLSHLEGLEIAVLADGSPLPAMTVQNGKITLPRPMYCVHAGLPYEAELQTLPAAFETQEGTALDRKRRMVSVVVKMLDSRGGRVGTENGVFDDIIQRSGEPFNTPLALKTQDYTLTLSGSHSLFPSVIFRQTDPLPVTISAVIARVA